MQTRLRARLAITTGLALAAAGGLTQAAQASQAAAAQAARPSLAAAPAAAPHTATLLYNQDNDNSGSGMFSQKFQAAKKAEDCKGADDFTVPKGQTWTITRMDVTGEYYEEPTGPAKSENVFFYKNKVKNKEDIPGVPVGEVTLKGKQTGGSFVISGITGVSLSAGNYWVSVQVNQSSSTGVWTWEIRTRQNGSPAVWENPGNGFGSGCTTWGNMEACSGTAFGPDFMFALYGSSTG